MNSFNICGQRKVVALVNIWVEVKQCYVLCNSTFNNASWTMYDDWKWRCCCQARIYRQGGEGDGGAVNSLPWALIPITRQRSTSPMSDHGGSACFRVIYYLKPGSSTPVADPVVIAWIIHVCRRLCSVVCAVLRPPPRPTVRGGSPDHRPRLSPPSRVDRLQRQGASLPLSVTVFVSPPRTRPTVLYDPVQIFGITRKRHQPRTGGRRTPR